MVQSSPCKRSYFPLLPILLDPPDAVAVIKGSMAYPMLSGTVRFYQTASGVLVYSEVTGLPDASGDKVFGFHIHEGRACRGNETDPFADAGMHYNPTDTSHPYHAGDLPPLFGNRGAALSLVLTDRFSVDEVIGRTVIIHSGPDDFTTQPSGNSGSKIGCGVIETCE